MEKFQNVWDANMTCNTLSKRHQNFQNVWDANMMDYAQSKRWWNFLKRLGCEYRWLLLDQKVVEFFETSVMRIRQGLIKANGGVIFQKVWDANDRNDCKKFLGKDFSGD